MPKPFDVTAKFLLQTRPMDWVRFFGFEANEVEILESDLSTVIANADKSLLLKVPGKVILNVEFQSSFEADELDRFLAYSVLLHRIYGLPVITIILLLRPEADHPSLTGTLELDDGKSGVYLWWKYSIVRLWETPVETLLTGGLGTLPLAPLANLQNISAESVVKHLKKRIAAETSELEAKDLWTSAELLMGLRYSKNDSRKLMGGLRSMNWRDSTTFMEIMGEGLEEGMEKGMEKGRVEEARELLIRLATKRLGTPAKSTLDSLSIIHSKDQLETLLERIFEVETWGELLEGA